MPNPGDKVKVITSKEEVEGILMPNEETDAVVIKLSSGYNVGIEKKKVKKIELIEKNKVKEVKKEKINQNEKLPIISILHTGGTIASKVDYKTGGVVARFEPTELINMFPELMDIVNIRSKLIGNMFSEDMRFGHYKEMAKAVKEEIKNGASGIIITHGTDTMGYSAAALAFVLENINIPVLLVGAQRSSDRGSSDAGVNLICAAEFIAKSDFTGVAICMHENTNDNNCIIMPACKTRKLHTSRRDAFKVVNDTPIAKINYENRKIDFLKKDYTKKNDHKLVVKDKFEDKVGLLKCHPNMFKEQFDFFKGYKGLVIEGTGLGHAPVDPPDKLHMHILDSIKDLIKNGTVVVMTSQCLFGRTKGHVYTAGVNLTEASVIYGEDMLPETAFVKLAWLLGNYDKKETVKLITENLRGEINNRLGQEFLD